MPRASREPEAPPTEAPIPLGVPFPVLGTATSQFAEISRGVLREEPTVAPRQLERGAVIFDVDGTLLDDMGLISALAGKVLAEFFGTPETEGRHHYLATTGMPFEAQLSQLYPEVPPAERVSVAQTFHMRKVSEAYATSHPFPDVPRLLKRLAGAGWTLAVSTGAEREMADLVLEREGLRYWFEDVLGSAQGTKREHLAEYRRRYPGVPIVLVGDSRFDLEAAQSVEGVVPVARATQMPGWTLSPDDLRRWGALWADYSLSELPEALEELIGGGPTASAKKPRTGSRRRKTR